jgi:hypothetical protein
MLGRGEWNMRKHKSTDRDLRLTNKHGGIIHTLERFEPGMVAKMKCGLVLVQWRDADSTGRRCKRCSKPSNAALSQAATTQKDTHAK